ncbi:MAG: hypothetical protein ACRCUG_03215 [Yersinia sp. (in: enterobacteria)]
MIATIHNTHFETGADAWKAGTPDKPRLWPYLISFCGNDAIREAVNAFLLLLKLFE